MNDFPNLSQISANFISLVKDCHNYIDCITHIRADRRSLGSQDPEARMHAVSNDTQAASAVAVLRGWIADMRIGIGEERVYAGGFVAGDA